MRFDYIIYPEAQRKLDSSGLTDRIKLAHKDGVICTSGFVSDSDVLEIAKEISSRKYLRAISENERSVFVEKLKSAWMDRDNLKWKVKRHSGESLDKLESEDFLNILGWKASSFLDREELFNYKKFGFSSIGEFTGTLGAAIEKELHDNSFRQGLVWGSTRQDGIRLLNEITGDGNSDLRIFQTDVTPYETVDPFGNGVSYRPESCDDKRVVAAYHSTEGTFMTSLLMWVNQMSLKPRSLENKANNLLEWSALLGQGGGTCAEHFGGFDSDPGNFLLPNWGFNLPILDSDNSTSEYTPIHLVSQGDGNYGMYLKPDKSLAIAYDLIRDGKVEPKKEIVMSFLPEEADHIIQGLLYQSARGMGRTSARQLIEIIKYRFSEEFPRELTDLNEKFSKSYSK